MRAVLLLALIAALFFGTVADAFHAHDVITNPSDTYIDLPSIDDGSVATIDDLDCGIHPGCTAALIPETPIPAILPVADGRQPITACRVSSMVEFEPDHPPIIS
ncbi:MAG: hypothetical protein B7Z02_13205 [Rhodobacterales bacterium 32-67-9]|nr:MAG: hypothetical protein B7Z02_13205 [Rhodobacterales bacterium 32-67-9]